MTVRYTPIDRKTFVGTGGTSLVIQACTVLQGVLLARLLGPTGRGELTVAILWPSVFAGVGLLGADVALSRMAARESDLGPLTRAAVWVALCTAAVTTGICGLLLPWLLPQSQTALLPVAYAFLAYIPLSHLGLNLIAVDQGAGHFRRFNVFRMMLYPVNLLLILAVWARGGYSLMAFAMTTVLASLVVVVSRVGIAMWGVRLTGPVVSPIRIWTQGLPFGLARGVETLYQYADKALLMILLGATEVGLYTAALTASSAVGSLTSASSMVTFTMAARDPKGSGFEGVARVFRAVALMWLALGGLLALALPFLVPLVYGRAFDAAVGPALLLIPGSALAGLSSLLEQAMRGQGRPYVGVEGRLAGLAALVLGGYLASRAWGMNGFCLAYVAAQAAGLIVLVIHTKRHYRPTSTFKALVPTLPEGCRLVLDAVKGMGAWIGRSSSGMAANDASGPS